MGRARVLFVTMVAALLTTLGTALPAVADPPEEETGTTVVLYQNPCTGEIEVVVGEFRNRIVRAGAFVQVIESDLTTSAGGIGTATQTIVVNQAEAVGVINAVADYPDGSRVKILIRAEGDVTQGAPIIDLNAVCVQSP